MFTIKKAAELTGVPEHTLRAWERRYSFVVPLRTESGYRVFDDEAIARIRAMRGLVDAGWAPREAAAEVSRRHAGGAGPLAEGAVEDLVEAAVRLDADAAARIISERFALADFEAVVDGWLMPALARLGREWASGRVSVAGEHLVANAVMGRLGAAYDAAGPAASGPPLVVGAPPGVHHVLGLLAFAVALRRARVATLYLGADVPLDSWVEAVVTSGARGAVTIAPRRSDAARAGEVAERLWAVRPGLPLWVGGRQQHAVAPACRPLGHHIGPAARELAAELAAA